MSYRLVVNASVNRSVSVIGSLSILRGGSTAATTVIAGAFDLVAGAFVAGAFVAGSAALIETLIQFCRPYIYTTALPPAVAEATRCSLRLVQQEAWRREHLQTLIAQFRVGCMQLGLTLTDSPTPIQGLLLGAAEAALFASRYLEEQGILVSAIRPPTVPNGTARLRISFSAMHSQAQVERLLAALATLAPQLQQREEKMQEQQA